MKKKILVMVALIVFAVSGWGIAESRAGDMPKMLKLSGGAMGQSSYMLMAILPQFLGEAIPGLKASVIAGGTIANIKLVDQKKVDIAFTLHNVYGNALRGEAPFKKKYKDLRVLCNIQGFSAFYFMVNEDTGLTSIEEIKEKKYPLKICTFLKSGSPEIYTRRLLEEYGMTYDDIKSWGGQVNFSQWTDCVSLIRDGHANALLGATALPSPFHAEAAKARKMRMLPIKEKVIQDMIKKYHDLEVIIPKGTYGITPYDMPTVGSTYYLFARKDLSDKIAYALVSQMAKHEKEVKNVHTTFKTFTGPKMAADLVGEVHPGALKFYKEKGWIH